METSLQVTLPTELTASIAELKKLIPTIEEEMLMAGAEVLKPEVETRLKRSITGKYAKGNLQNSVDIKIVRTQGKRGKVYKTSVVYFKGTVNGVRNGLKAAILEYGKYDQPARPFMRLAMQAKRTEIFDAMENAFYDRVEKLF
jgi:HK97 gp10 family phage protein